MSDLTESGLTYEEPSSGTLCCGPSPADYAPIAEPIVAEPVVPEPVVSQPVMAEPVVAEPVVAEPIVAEPVIAEPSQAAVQQTPMAEPSAPAPPETSAVIGGPTPGVTLPIDVLSAAPGPAEPQGQEFSFGRPLQGPVTELPADSPPPDQADPLRVIITGQWNETYNSPYGPFDGWYLRNGEVLTHDGGPGWNPRAVAPDPTSANGYFI